MANQTRHSKYDIANKRGGDMRVTSHGSRVTKTHEATGMVLRAGEAQ
jgi:hypothetical protein